jgi:hypothetical protein
MRVSATTRTTGAMQKTTIVDTTGITGITGETS